MDLSPQSWRRVHILLVGVGILTVLLLAPATTTDRAPIELIIGDIPAESLYAILILIVTFIGVGYIVSTRHDE